MKLTCCWQVITISFARNHLKTVHHISTITQFLPNVQNISLEDNLIKTFENLDPISGAGKLKHLRELVLLGNPLRETMIKRSGNDRYYIRYRGLLLSIVINSDFLC